jgi:Cu(I)/Ag(I) efflux system membrane fusion protein
VLDTGRRQIAYRLTQEGAYELVELKLGSRAQAVDDTGQRRDYYLVLDGLKESDQVVVQSGFLLDSQRQIEGMPSLLYPAGQSASMSGHAGHGAMSTNAGSSSPNPPPVTKMPAGHQH